MSIIFKYHKPNKAWVTFLQVYIYFLATLINSKSWLKDKLLIPPQLNWKIWNYNRCWKYTYLHIWVLRQKVGQVIVGIRCCFIIWIPKLKEKRKKKPEVFSYSLLDFWEAYLPPPKTYVAPTLQIEECLEPDTCTYPTLTHIALNQFHFLKLLLSMSCPASVQVLCSL